jgi:(S)-2-hydroxyglutarate dehydrogenase
MKYDIIIIGGGIVGLASAYQLLEKKPSLKLAVLEKENAVALHQTGNNSGVIHSGIYYKPGSLKAQNCLRGYEMLLDFSRKHEIPHEVCGKIIVATKADEKPILYGILERGKQNGMKGLRIIPQEELTDFEPHVSGVEGVFVPQAGIINYKKVAEKYAELIQKKGGQVLLNHQVLNIKKNNKSVVITTTQGDFETNLVISCAGLYADKITKMTDDEGKYKHLKVLAFRGEYYELKPEKRYLVKNLIYPVPNPAFPFLGVHFTRMIEGGIEAGPNAVLAYKREGYKRTDVDFKDLFETLTYKGFHNIMRRYWREGLDELHRSWSKTAFVNQLQNLIPEIQKEDLEPGGAGVRAMLTKPNGDMVDDFFITEAPHIIHVQNAPSPAATSSLSIGLTVAEKALARV